MDDLEGYRLTFNETAFINELSVTDNLKEMEQLFSYPSLPLELEMEAWQMSSTNMKID